MFCKVFVSREEQTAPGCTNSRTLLKEVYNIRKLGVQLVSRSEISVQETLQDSLTMVGTEAVAKWESV